MSLEGSLEIAGTSSGDTVSFAFTVTNTGSTSVDLRFSDACKAEFVVEDEDREVWRFTDGRMFTQMLSTERLEPGAETTYEAEWERPQPGEYTAVAELRARNTTCEARADLALPS